MKKSVLFIVFSFAYFFGFSQHQLPKNPKPGKCYVRLLEVDKKIAWKEIDCNSDKKKLAKARANQKGKFLIHLKELYALGYKVDTLNIGAEKNIIAHNKYLKVLKKEARRKRRLSKK